MKKDYSSILLECSKIAKERQAQYGEATASIKLATRMLDEMFGVKLTPQQFCYTIIALKLSRQKFNHKDDNILDLINYFAIALACKEKEEEE